MSSVRQLSVQELLAHYQDEVLEAFNCQISFTPNWDPRVHTCGKSYGLEGLQEWFENHDTCPNCRVQAQLSDFTPNHDLREALVEFADKTLRERYQRESEGVIPISKEAMIPPEPQQSSVPGISFAALPVGGSGKGYRKQAVVYLRGLDQALVNQHVKKDSTHEILWDSHHQLVAIEKSGKWRIYRIGGGAGNALAEHPSLTEAIKFVTL